MLADDYIEALVGWSEKGHAAWAEEWFAERGLSPMRMRVGLLIRANRATLETVFGINLEGAEPPITLPVPDELKEAVAFIMIPKPREIFDREKGVLR